MNTIWRLALAVGGAASVGAFVLWGLYKEWLSLRIFPRLTRKQTFWIMCLFLVLVFAAAIALPLAFRYTAPVPATPAPKSAPASVREPSVGERPRSELLVASAAPSPRLLDSAPSTQAPTPAPTRASTEPVKLELTATFYGGWKQHGGDGNMDTNADDLVEATTVTELKWNADSVSVEGTFRCAEWEGNGTSYDGTQAQQIYTAPVGKRIVDVTFDGSNRLTFVRTSKGKHHEDMDYNVNGTYWKALQYRIDSDRHDDSPYVGFRGTLVVTILLAPK